MHDRFRVGGLELYECDVEIYENPNHEYTTETEETTKIKRLMAFLSSEPEPEIETKNDCKWLFDLHIYKLIRKTIVNESGMNINWFQAAKGLIGRSDKPMEEVFQENTTEEEITEMVQVASFIGKKLTKTKAPMDLAKKFVDDYERPEKLRKYLHSQNRFFPLVKPEKLKKEKEFIIKHWQDADEENRLEYYRLNPLEIDDLPEKERKELLKNQYVREAYHDAKIGEDVS